MEDKIMYNVKKACITIMVFIFFVGIISFTGLMLLEEDNKVLSEEGEEEVTFSVADEVSLPELTEFVEGDNDDEYVEGKEENAENFKSGSEEDMYNIDFLQEIVSLSIEDFESCEEFEAFDEINIVININPLNKTTYTVTTQSELAEAVASANMESFDTVTEIFIGSSFNVNTTQNVTGNIILTGEGSLVMTANNRHFSIKSGGYLTIAENSSIALVSSGSVVSIRGGIEIDGGTFVMYGGEISGNGVGVHVRSGNFELYNGKIIGNGVINNGEFTMYGGIIADTSGTGVTNTSSVFIMHDGKISGHSQGGVLAQDGSSFIMHGGSIVDNENKYVIPDYSGNFTLSVSGGGVFISFGCTFDMYGGSISRNKAIGIIARVFSPSNYIVLGELGYGGGVHVSGGSFNMYGGEIADNAANCAGGGVFVSIGTFVMHGGEIRGNVADGMFDSSVSSSTAGGGICLQATERFIMRGGKITDNYALNSSGSSTGGIGGGIGSLLLFTEVEIYDGEISDNKADDSGGGLYISSLDMYGGKIKDNVSGDNGGGINVTVCNMYRGEISGNTASGNGGGIYCGGADENRLLMNMQGGIVSNNSASGNGGGIYASTPENIIQIQKVVDEDVPTIAGNFAGENGGGLYIQELLGLDIREALITGNKAVENGGGVYIGNEWFFGYIATAGVYVIDVIVSGNEAGLEGGGIYSDLTNNYFRVYFTIGGSDVVNNEAGNGGGIYFTTKNTLVQHQSIDISIYDTSIGNNKTFGNGGGIYLTSGNMDVWMIDSSVIGNSAGGNGGGVYTHNYGAFAITDTVLFSSNSAIALHDYGIENRGIGANVMSMGSVWNIDWFSTSILGTHVLNNYDINYTGGLPVAFYELTVLDSYSSASGSGKWRVGAAVTINAGGHSGGLSFINWESSLGSVSIANTETANMVMPNSDLILKAIWGDTSPLTITASSVSVVYSGELFSSSDFFYSMLPAGVTRVEAVVSGSRAIVGETENKIISYKLYNGNVDVTDIFVNITLKSGILTVKQRPLEITAASSIKAYDGTALVNSGWLITNSTSLADSHYISEIIVLGSRVDVGTGVNEVSGAKVMSAGVDVTSNYSIIYVDGILIVTESNQNLPDNVPGNQVEDAGEVEESLEETEGSENEEQGNEEYYPHVAENSSTDDIDQSGTQNDGLDTNSESGDLDINQHEPYGDDNGFDKTSPIEESDTAVPLGSFYEFGSWSLLNLIMSIAAVLSAIIILMSLLVARRRVIGEKDSGDWEKDTSEIKRRILCHKYSALLVGIVPMVLFLVLESISLPVVWITRWTPIIGGFFIAHVLLLAFHMITRRNLYKTLEEISKLHKTLEEISKTVEELYS